MPAHVKRGKKGLHSMWDVSDSLEDKAKSVSALGVETHYSYCRRQTEQPKQQEKGKY